MKIALLFSGSRLSFSSFFFGIVLLAGFIVRGYVSANYLNKLIVVELNNEFEETVHLTHFKPSRPNERMDVVAKNLDEQHLFETHINEVFHIVSEKTGETLQVLKFPNDLDEDNLRIWVGPDGEPFFEGVENLDYIDEDEDEDDDNDNDNVEDDENPSFEVILVNHYEDIDLYLVSKYGGVDRDGRRTRGLARTLLEENVGKKETLACRAGDIFEVVHRTTSSVVERFVIGEDDNHTEIIIGPIDNNEENDDDNDEDDSQEEEDRGDKYDGGEL